MTGTTTTTHLIPTHCGGSAVFADLRDKDDARQEKAWKTLEKKLLSEDPDYPKKMQEAAMEPADPHDIEWYEAAWYAAQGEAREIVSRAAQTVIATPPRKGNPARRNSRHGGASGSKSNDSDDPAEPELDPYASIDDPRESDYLPFRDRCSDPEMVLVNCRKSKDYTAAEVWNYTSAVEIICTLYPDLASSDRNSLVFLPNKESNTRVQCALIPADYSGPLGKDMDTMAHVFAYLSGEEQFANLLRIKALLGSRIETDQRYKGKSYHTEYTEYLGVLYRQLKSVSPDMSELRGLLRSEKPDEAALKGKCFTIPRGRMTKIVISQLKSSKLLNFDDLSKEMAKIPVPDCPSKLTNFLQGIKPLDSLKYDEYLWNMIEPIVKSYEYGYRNIVDSVGGGDISNGLAEILLRSLLDFDLRKYHIDSLCAMLRSHLNSSRNVYRDIFGPHGILPTLVTKRKGEDVVIIISLTSEGKMDETYDMLGIVSADDTEASSYLRQSAPSSPEDSLAEKQRERLIDRIFATPDLSDLESRILVCRNDGATHEELAEIFGISKSRVRKILESCHQKLLVAAQKLGVMSYADI
ncbi:sigma-70 region 4 domain protein [Acidithiobacillus ferrivorans SS3]|uniref:Sigma-70 region 4 domain protein n=1 Tax=Acidithiobacillus ferrivorans SS3 TaxID=743299 RepID=G0JLI8_9PROT|nr:sigma factor-like helix-turn-helix DNA-binding protein [Acidithiobacillus ferrivorans]AEM48037.1 sigma-70 region 4 domain protein [Acidithiobacillus ferrivorans SS3]